VSHIEHKAQSPTSIRCAVLTISDTRTEATDTGGKAIATLLVEAGHEVVAKRILRDEPMLVQQLILGLIADEEARVDAIITTGGTGITSRDSTYEVVNGLLHKRLDGFGELFRMLSYEQIGAAAMMSRACAGLVAGHIVIALPGSEAAVRLAMERLIVPELGHMVQQAHK